MCQTAAKDMRKVNGEDFFCLTRLTGIICHRLQTEKKNTDRNGQPYNESETSRWTSERLCNPSKTDIFDRDKAIFFYATQFKTFACRSG